MKQPTIAIVRWIPPERGGRVAPTFGSTYRGVARFEDARDHWPPEAWSLTVRGIRDFGHDSPAVICELELVSSEAPRSLISIGARFELCEGRRVVAKGVVLPAEVPVPAQMDEFALCLLGG